MGTLQDDTAVCTVREPNFGTTVRVLTWNINGLRKAAASYGGVKRLLDQFQADIVSFQEIKITRAGLVEHDLARAQGYHCFFTHCKVHRKPSYAGVATFVRAESGLRTLACTTSLRDAQFFGSTEALEIECSAETLVEIDAEGRVLVTDHGHFVLFNVYAPCISSSDEDEKTDKRREFKQRFLALLEVRISQVRKRGRNVLLVGDLNACASQMDHGYAISDNNFFESQWSKWMIELLGTNSSDPPRLVDCFRRMHPHRTDAFTCWNTKTGARENNYGTRIDYIIASSNFAEQALRFCDIMPEFLGSDHCPVRADFGMPLLTGVDKSIPANRRPAGLSRTNDDSDGNEVADWCIHPPECSCFYLELSGKQEKLTKYFSSGDPSTELAVSRVKNDETVGKLTGVADASMSSAFGVVRASGRNGSKLRSCSQKSQSTRTGLPIRKSSSDCANRGRGITPVGARQSKLGFAYITPLVESVHSSAPLSTADATLHKNTTMALEAQGGHLVRNLATETRENDDRALKSGNFILPRTDVVVGGVPDHLSGQASDYGSTINVGNRVVAVGGSTENESAEKSAEAWKMLFRKKTYAPLCSHGEPSIQRTVVKHGENHRRRFYTCARAAGKWPTDRNARCNFFQWRTDGVQGYKDKPPQNDNVKRQRKG